MTGGWSSKPEWPSIEPDKILNAVVDSVIAANPNVNSDFPVHVYADKDNNIKIENVLLEKVYDVSVDLAEEKVYNNLSPTHNPYTNPNAQVYYECKCGAILDPGTKSFAALNNAASDKGWKVRWKQNGEGYEPFCVECGKDVE